ncbi:hypothetical protein HAX54_020947 [Datura stramonium]|uniref:Uncharacterized protein n=1 Tax=Datura stramonium TaxID=4076 RepID=A0ABS8US36_DATST|nr:hypothetical protein [Datura stramonium]
MAPPNYLTEYEAHGKTLLPVCLVSRKDRHHRPSALEVEKVGYDSFPHRIASGSQGVGWLVDGGSMSATTSYLKVPPSLSWTSTVEHRLVNLSLAGCNAFLMVIYIMDRIALANRTSWLSCILALCTMLSKLGGVELWNSSVWSRAATV